MHLWEIGNRIERGIERSGARLVRDHVQRRAVPVRVLQ
jgi:hypothetical protein